MWDPIIAKFKKKLKGYYDAGENCLPCYTRYDM